MRKKRICTEKSPTTFTEHQLVDLHAAKTSWHHVTTSPTGGKRVFSHKVEENSSLGASFKFPSTAHLFPAAIPLRRQS